MSSEELEKPDFDGRQFPAAETEDDWPSRSHGWALLLAGIFAAIGFSSLRRGLVLSAAVFFALALAVFVLAAVSVRRELRKYMRYRRRL